MDRYQIIRIIHDYMSRYEKKNKSDSQNVFGCRSFFSFYFFYGLSFLYILIRKDLYFL